VPTAGHAASLCASDRRDNGVEVSPTSASRKTPSYSGPFVP
jgi:hypothetical protein